MSLDNTSSNFNNNNIKEANKWPPVDLRNIESKYICSQCKNILQNAHQADDCCCRFCLQCLDTIIENGDGTCPKCNSKLVSNLRIPDNMFQKKINKLNVKCQFKDLSAGCEWSGALIEYRDHFSKHFDTKLKHCPFCSKEFKSKNDLEFHLDKENGDCLRQPLECPFNLIGCDTTTAFDSLKASIEMKSRDSDAAQQSQQSDAEMQCFTREILNNHKTKNCAKHLELVHTYFNNRIESLENEMKSYRYAQCSSDVIKPAVSVTKMKASDDCGAASTSLINNEQLLETKLMDLKTKIDMLETNQKSLVDDLTRLTLMYDNLKQENSKYKDGVEKYKSICQDLHRTLALTQVSLLTLEERIVNQEKISYNGTLLWKITNVSERIQEAKSGRQTSFYSPPFYTDRNGFKMCARIYLNGDGNGRNTHLSLFFVILRGENDALLQWPFRQKVTFILIDQSTSESRENIYDAFRPDPNSTSFRRPLSEMNIASGLPVFCPLGKLLSDDHEYIKDNTMFIKIIVDTKDLPEI